MKFEAPANAPAHCALLDAISSAGLDREACRRLLWLINAHPTLVAHVRVFEHLLSHLESHLCDQNLLVWAGNWKQDIPQWRGLCRWIVANRHILPHLDGLDEFDRQPRSTQDNPHLHKGVGRHGVVAALWNRHETVETYPPRDDGSQLAAERYFQLQTHLFLSYADSRHRLSALEFYESYADPIERPIAPALTAGVGLAIREFSHQGYSWLFERFPSACPTDEYPTALDNFNVAFPEIDDGTVDDVMRYLGAIKRYFLRFDRVLTGWRPPQHRRRHQGGGGGRQRRPGFVHFSAASGVYFDSGRNKPDDTDFPFLPGVPVYIDLDGEENDDPNLNEQSGLAPEDTLEEVFSLYFPEELNGKLASARHQYLAMEMQAQHLPYSYLRLTPFELRRIVNCRVQAFHGHVYFPPNTRVQQARREAIAAMMLKLMLLLGQPSSVIRLMRFAWHTLPQVSQETLPAVDQVTLLLQAPAANDWDHATVAGFVMPAIIPDYKTELPDALDEVNRPLCDSFLLPDMLGAGAELLEFLRQEARPNERIFGIEPETARAEITRLIERCGVDRLTTDKLGATLPGILLDQTGDQSLVWMVTADQNHANEPRIHYTRHAVPVLQRAYCNAIKRLASMGRLKPKQWTPPLRTGSETTASVGARFVILLAELRTLIAQLLNTLRLPMRDPFRHTQIRRYHDSYLLYTWLFQSLQTTVRATTRPNSLYQAGERHASINQRVLCGLSDKDGRYTTKARLVSLSPSLLSQFSHYRAHLDHLVQRLGMRRDFQSVDAADLPLLVISEKKEWAPLSPRWIEAELATRFAPLPANFHRAFLRTELLERGCNAESVDAFLGHANLGESPFSRYSTFDYGMHLPLIEQSLDAIRQELGLVPVASRLVPHALSSLVSS